MQQKDYIRLPRAMIYDLRNGRYRGTHTSYRACLAYAAVVAALTTLTGGRQTITIRDVRRLWRRHNLDHRALRRILDNYDTTPLAQYIYIDTSQTDGVVRNDTPISVTYDWMSAVVGDREHLRYVRVGIQIIDACRQYPDAVVDAALHAYACRLSPQQAYPAAHRGLHQRRSSVVSGVQAVLHMITCGKVHTTHAAKQDTTTAVPTPRQPDSEPRQPWRDAAIHDRPISPVSYDTTHNSNISRSMQAMADYLGVPHDHIADYILNISQQQQQQTVKSAPAHASVSACVYDIASVLKAGHNHA